MSPFTAAVLITALWLSAAVAFVAVGSWLVSIGHPVFGVLSGLLALGTLVTASTVKASSKP